jgi:acid phosphatase type 7
VSNNSESTARRAIGRLTPRDGKPTVRLLKLVRIARARIPSAWLLLPVVLGAGSAGAALPSAAAGSLPVATSVAPAPRDGAAASRKAGKRKAVCPVGHVALALTGPGGVTPQQPTSYTFVARPCGGGGVKTLTGVRLYVRGPQTFAWVIARLRPKAVARRVVTLTFPLPPDIRLLATITLEARSHRGQLLGRRRIGVHYQQSPPSPLLAAVGDIACPSGDTHDACQQLATANLTAGQQPSAVAVLGDNQYESGLLSEYDGAGAYNSTWGQFNPIVYPTPGNHEYAASSSASGYFTYFGARAPSAYYSYELGSWHIVSLNSNCTDLACLNSPGGKASSAEVSWLRSDLAVHPNQCILAYWHHPRFSSGGVGNSPGVAPFWEALYAAHADVVLNGHDHMYERFGQQDPGQHPTSAGIREFVVGTGGMSLFGPGIVQPNTEFLDNKHFGVLFLTLHPGSYDWAFRATDGTVLDSGSTACHR